MESGNPWVLPIWTAYHEAQKAGVLPTIPGYLSQLAIDLSTRLDLLPFVIKRIDSKVQKIYKAAESVPLEERCRPNEKCYGIRIDEELKQTFLLDIDSLLFEFDSCCELITRFIGKLHTIAGDAVNESEAGQRVKQILIEAGKETTWFTSLVRDRNHFIHAAAPWLAVDLSDLSRIDVLIMRENLLEFSDPKKFLRLSNLEEIIQGFIEATAVLQKHLITFLLELVKVDQR